MNYYKNYKLYKNINYLMSSRKFLKEINFSRDIDKKKSGYYILHELGLEFIYNKEKSFELVDYKDLTKKIYSMKNEVVREYFAKDLLNGDVIIHFKLNSNNIKDGARIGIGLTNNEVYDSTIGIGVDSSKVWLSGNICDERLAIKPIKLKNNLSSDRNCIIDILHGKFYYNGIKLGNDKFINYLNSKFETILKTFKSVVLQNIADRSVTLKDLNLKNLIVANYGQGTVYLKPFILKNVDKIKMYVFYRGNIKIEMLDTRCGEWLTFNNELLKSEELINLRVHLNSYDIIFNMIFIED